jgi:hypothetical protein
LDYKITSNVNIDLSWSGGWIMLTNLAISRAQIETTMAFFAFWNSTKAVQPPITDMAPTIDGHQSITHNARSKRQP